MYAIIGEDNSDVEMLDVLIRRIAGKPNLSVKKKGYAGCAELLVKGSRAIETFHRIGCSKFVICYDSDRSKPDDRFNEITQKIILKSGVAGQFCALVPVQEIESWILADIKSVSNLIPSWRPEREYNSPEAQDDPKEFLEKISRRFDHKPRYTHSIHNPKIARHLDLKSVAAKCPSSLPLFELVQGGKGNYPARVESQKTRTDAVLARLRKDGH